MKKYLQIDLIILAMRLLLAFTLWNYGYSKLTGGQFGITELELNTPIKDLSLFRISWYLFKYEPFNSFIGISQIITAILLVYKKTFLLGTLMAIPIFLNVLMVDLTIMPFNFKVAFFFRLSFYLIFIGLILWYHKKQITTAFKNLISAPNLKFVHNKKWFLIIPVYMLLLEIINVIPQMIFHLIFYSDYTINYLKNIF